MPNHLTPEEQRRLEKLKAEIAPRKAEIATILNRARQRKHYANTHNN